MNELIQAVKANVESVTPWLDVKATIEADRQERLCKIAELESQIADIRASFKPTKVNFSSHLCRLDEEAGQALEDMEQALFDWTHEPAQKRHHLMCISKLPYLGFATPVKPATGNCNELSEEMFNLACALILTEQIHCPSENFIQKNNPDRKRDGLFAVVRRIGGKAGIEHLQRYEKARSTIGEIRSVMSFAAKDVL